MKLPRRHFLKGSGALLAIPVLESLLPREARADATAPRRLFFWIQDNGTLRDEWTPTPNPDGSFVLPPVLAPLSAVQKDVVVIRGLDNHATYNNKGNAHDTGNATLLTGIQRTDQANPQSGPYGGGISLDQYLASRLPTAPRRSVNLQLAGGTFTISYTAANQPVTGLNGLSEVYSDLFGNFGGTTDPAVLVRRKAKRQSVIDSVMENFKQVNGRASADDQKKLDQHLSLLRDLENRLALEAQGPSCSPTNPVQTGVKDAQAGAALVSLIFSCQLSHVASFMPFTPDSETPSPAEYSGGYHSWVHRGPDYGLDPVRTREDWRTTMTWWSQNFASAVQLFKNTPDLGGSLLDNSLLAWVNVFGMGSYHDFYETPVVLAGSAQGALKTGRLLDYRNARAGNPTNLVGYSTGAKYVNETTNNLHLSICQAMGFHDVTTFGDPQFCSGGLPGLVS